MKRISRAIALGLPVLAGCTSDRVTSLPTAAHLRADVAPSAGPPLVYGIENTAAGLPTPNYPATVAALPINPVLPDPFTPYLGGTRDTSFAGWEARRAEIMASIQKYEIGPKPPASDVDVTASYTSTSATAGTIRVVVTRRSNGQSLTLTSAVALPSTPGPFPAIIGMNSASGSVPATVFTSRNIARVTYTHNQVTTYYGKSPNDPYFKLYPEYGASGVVGQYSAWSWGVSRLIDGIQLLARQGALPIDTLHLGVTGCSYAGKMALYAGAFDERVALTIAQESGGGGAPAWRASEGIEPDGNVEKLSNTDGSWFITGMKSAFSGDNAYRLPDDHHELMALVAPRALLATGNTSFTWLSNRANYVSSSAAAAAFTTLGVGDRFGYYIDGNHNHCAVPDAQVPAMQAFVDKYMAGLTANTSIAVSPQTSDFTSIDVASWMPWAQAAAPIQAAMAVQPGQVSVNNTSVVNVVLYSSDTFDATAVNAANTRLTVNGAGAGVAPIMRGTAANTSVADVNGDGRPDRVIGFSVSALKAAGYAPGFATLWLRPVTTPYGWEAFAAARPTVTQ